VNSRGVRTVFTTVDGGDLDAGGVACVAEYYHDPTAPPANSLRPTVFAAVRNGDDRILLVQRADTRDWELPGGTVEIGESATTAVVREVAEESGVTISVTGLSGVYTDPGHVMVNLDGEVRQQFSLCVHATPVSGRPRPDHDEVINAAWIRTDELPHLSIHPAIRLRIDHAITNPDHPQLA
jgi:ADP-ribose pyrophosphatase YjhB (NUDIX family)